MFCLEVYFLMALVVKGKVNINEFIDLSKSEKLFPAMFTPVKSVMVSKVDKIMVMNRLVFAERNKALADTLTDLSGITISSDVLTMIGDPAGLSGEWNLPDNCRGGVSVCMVDKRMERADRSEERRVGKECRL